MLIAEDEYITRQGIQHMVDWNAEGFEIVGEATNGKDALEMVEKLRPHIVLTDIVMPVMDGVELARNLRLKHSGIQLVVLSSYSDFGYVRDSFQNGAVDYILKPTLNPTNLLKTMKQVAARIPGLKLHGCQDLSSATCIGQLLSGFSGETVQKQLQKKFQKSHFMLIGMDAARIFGQEASVLENQERLLSQSLDDNLSGYTYVQLLARESILLLVINFSQLEQQSVLAALRTAVEKIAQDEPRTFYVTSSVFSDLALMKEIYHGSFINNMDRYFYYKGNHLLTSGEFCELRPTVKFDITRYTESLEALQVDHALDLLETYVDAILTEHSLDEMELKTLVQNAWYQMISVLEDQELNPDNLSYLKRDCLIKIHACAYSENFAQIFSILQADFRAIIRKYEVNVQRSTIQKILKYIGNHYSEPLTLASLAQRFNFSYTYLSSYFHTHHKEGFSEYLNKERIRHAAELLQQDILSVSEVCGAVGYTDQSYFSRVFKKLTGFTPREYRRKYGTSGV